jgi:myo-inositol 2-dehydrogenase/D-chiro-inositol 1-dehydrogenase
LYLEAKEAVGAVRATGVPVMLGLNRRFDPNHAALREEVKSGTLGNLENIQMNLARAELAAD